MTTNTTEMVFTNARIVLPDEVVEGSLLVRGGRIADISASKASGGIDCEGDHIVPGLVELHTDHIEGHFVPRPKVRWNRHAALQAHDAQIASSGITTVFDALRVGIDEDAALGSADMTAMGEAIASATSEGRLRAEHFIHLRCEVSAADVMESFEALVENPRVRLASLMDHAPGQRQFVDLAVYRTYYQGKTGMSDEVFDAFCARRVRESEDYAPGHRLAIAKACRERGVTLASHDDATPEHVAEGLELGVAIAEFPTTIEAARLAGEAGLSVLMGAPNVVRGGSHSGNVSAADLIDIEALDILSSDYVPFSLIQAVFLLAPKIGLPRALRLVTLAPARAADLSDRGAILPGLRADLVRVRAGQADEVPPVVRGVWREGERVA
ncbi:phosphonate metabolism protein PhnM [Aureimonas sp. Leaf460]|nr:phosphonate metabolism protein PhnM [Aureimonas sp. Leaf427]KQT73419.1 phosphonate metabolism protein PhnM [Aureimonas sp. Leaf460]